MGVPMGIPLNHPFGKSNGTLKIPRVFLAKDTIKRFIWIV